MGGKGGGGEREFYLGTPLLFFLRGGGTKAPKNPLPGRPYLSSPANRTQLSLNIRLILAITCPVEGEG